jgi:hypothetical protein
VLSFGRREGIFDNEPLDRSLGIGRGASDAEMAACESSECWFIILDMTPSASLKAALLFCLGFSVNIAAPDAAAQNEAAHPQIKVGIIGLDTSHVIAFTQTLNKGPKKPEDAPKVAGARVVAAYPQGSRDIESSVKRVPEYIEKVRELGVEIVDSIEALVEKVDAVLLESNDGRVHWEQLQPVLKARKPVFIDKPIAGSLVDAIRILEAAKKANVPLFCSSSLRYGASTQRVRNGSVGKVRAAETFSPVNLEATHPDLFWYGVHGCESLFTVLGTGCESVKRSEDADGKVVVEGQWSGGRTGIFRQENGRDRKGYGGIAHGESGDAAVGAYDGYDVLLYAIIEMFRSGKAPVSMEETIELYAFMEAADESKKLGGAAVSVQETIKKARLVAASKP